MMDLGSFAMSAVAHGSRWAMPGVFALGALSSIGPCAAPRVLAITGLIAQARWPALVGGVFVGGTLFVYAGFAFVSSYVAQLVTIASYVYAVVALLAIGSAIWMLVGADYCVHRESKERSGSLGAAFVSGAGFALLVSPCCTPIIGAILAYSGAIGARFPLTSMALLVAFGLGHAMPVFLVLGLGRRPMAWLTTSHFSQLTSTVMASLMLVVGVFYAALV
jgi:cytochrome c biogenesis protein CcdA